MSEIVRGEVLFFLSSIVTGVLLMWIYGVFLVLRKSISHKNWVISLEDFGYWCLAALIIFAMIFEKNHGKIRVHAFVGILMGVWLQWNVQRLFLKIWIKLLKKPKKTGKMAKNR